MCTDEEVYCYLLWIFQKHLGLFKKGYANYQRIQTKKLQYRKFGITGLKSSLRATEKYEVLQFDVCCKAIDQNSDCGCDRCAILCLDSLLTYASVQYKRGAGVGKTIDTSGMLHHPGASLSECLIHPSSSLFL